VGVFQGASHVEGDVDGVAHTELFAARQQGLGAGTVHILQDEVVFVGSAIWPTAKVRMMLGWLSSAPLRRLAIEAIDVRLVCWRGCR